jgi:hypothetical protein
MKIVNYFIFIVIFGFSELTLAETESCKFMKDLENILAVSPQLALTENKIAKDGEFLSVADGFAPSYPGFIARGEVSCVEKNHGFEMIWAGADYYECEGQSNLASKMNKFAGRYNILLKSKLTKAGSYQCTDKKLELSRKVKCLKTGQDTCTGNEDWFGALNEFTKYVWSLDSTSNVGMLPNVYGVYSVSIRHKDHFSAIRENACKIFPNHKIAMNVTIEMEIAIFNRNKGVWDRNKLDTIHCDY